MLAGMWSQWKCPIVYFLTDKIAAKTRAELVRMVLEKATDVGLRHRSPLIEEEKPENDSGFTLTEQLLVEQLAERGNSDFMENIFCSTLVDSW